MMTSEFIDIQLLGRQFSVSVKNDEKALFLEAVALTDDRLKELSTGKASSSAESVALMTALSIAHEFVTSQSASGVDLPAYRRRIHNMAQHIDHALTEQENLF